ncbi:ATP-binding protein [Fuchsiella alkaliacetigena]|uniref:ATP-binding protein n=1 Tax=Fuchsiella alkaliacetigena TaxID=957042 RepID=UPI00200A7473|nr:ATP-binding protein [Fuchsiella alkaliacetigena]MCK8823718.1 cell wall metabolism sensor histidine kinase WalK [Fuchsiella alkaliacetigena]
MKQQKIRQNTLFRRLLIRFLLISLIIIVVLGFSTIYFFENIYFEKSEEEIVQNSQVMIDFVAQALQREDQTTAFNWLKIIAQLNSGQAWIVDENSRLVLSYPSVREEQGEQIELPEFEKVLAGNIISQRVDSSYFERPMLLISLPIYQGEDIDNVLLVFTSVAGINSTVNQVQKLMLTSSIIAVLLAMLIAYNWSRSLSDPLRKMSKTAIELSQGNFGKQISTDEQGEIKTLAESMNYLSTKLESTIEDLVKERNKLKYILTGMEEGVLAIDEQHQIILVNSAVKELFNLSAVKGANFTEVIEHSGTKETYLESLATGQSYHEEFSLNKNGTPKRLLLHCTPIYTEKEEFWGVVGLFQDISERWRFEQLQKDFVTNASHELKAPLTSIQGSAEILLDGVVDSTVEEQDYLQIILQETNRLTKLVEEILELSEFEAQAGELVMTEVNVKQLLTDVSTVFNKILIEEEIKLEVEKPTSELYIWANQEKIKQVLLNLLENAYKYSQGEDLIVLAAVAEGERVKFWVQDYGIGVPADELQNIWTRFYKVDKARTPTQEGSGLGLSIVKWIVEAHGGEVFVESELGQGSIFGFYLERHDLNS